MFLAPVRSVLILFFFFFLEVSAWWSALGIFIVLLSYAYDNVLKLFIFENSVLTVCTAKYYIKKLWISNSQKQW
jgi:hypothetical protein